MNAPSCSYFITEQAKRATLNLTRTRSAICRSWLIDGLRQQLWLVRLTWRLGLTVEPDETAPGSGIKLQRDCPANRRSKQRCRRIIRPLDEGRFPRSHGGGLKQHAMAQGRLRSARLMVLAARTREEADGRHSLADPPVPRVRRFHVMAKTRSTRDIAQRAAQSRT